jgi:lysophospholipase L1-like esterase
MKPHAHRLQAGLFVVLLTMFGPASHAQSSGPFELKDGDRVVLLGGTFIERDQSYGYLETLLTSRFPDRKITFRNLGWSGDTVWGEARSRFGPPAEGFAHLKDHVEALKPTVLFVNYGLNESFAGKAGLPRFEQGLNTLLDVLDKTGARIVLITPRRLEKLAPPLPDPTEANERLADYVAALRKAAEKRKYRVVDLFDGWKPDPADPLTDNGIHLTAEGYRRAGIEIASSLGLRFSRVFVALNAWEPRVVSAENCKVDSLKTDGPRASFRTTNDRLQPPRPLTLAKDDPLDRRIIVVNPNGLPAGSYDVAIDGKRVGRIRYGTDFAIGLAEDPASQIEQVERLREAINAKNELYFHRWRPQNETYLFGFRKHEQGNNAREIPLFDPLVAEKEAEIARLRVPVPHTYEIIRKD